MERDAGHVPKALRQALADAPGPPLSPVEYSLDAATGAIGVLSSSGYVQPTLPTLAAFASCLQPSSVGEELLALDRLRACFPNESREVRLGCATRGASRTGYLEAQGNGLRTYLRSLGADDLLRRATEVAASLGPGSRPEGVGVRLDGPDARRMKLYLPVRCSSPDRFRSTLRRYSSADWASLLLDTLALLYGAGDVFVGGRLMLTLATDRDLPGLDGYPASSMSVRRVPSRPVARDPGPPGNRSRMAEPVCDRARPRLFLGPDMPDPIRECGAHRWERRKPPATLVSARCGPRGTAGYLESIKNLGSLIRPG